MRTVEWRRRVHSRNDQRHRYHIDAQLLKDTLHSNDADVAKNVHVVGVEDHTFLRRQFIHKGRLHFFVVAAERHARPPQVVDHDHPNVGLGKTGTGSSAIAVRDIGSVACCCCKYGGQAIGRNAGTQQA